jgi:thioredoxin reductase
MIMDDVIVVGGSFAGISAALALARARRSVRVLDSGLPRNRFSPAAHNLFGFDGVPPADILSSATAQLEAYPTVTFETARATAAAQTDDGFTLTLDTGEVRQAHILILAYGVTDQFPDLPGFAECWGKSVLHCPYCHGFEVAGRRWGALVPMQAISHAVPLYRDWTDDLTVFADGAELDTAAREIIDRCGAKIVAETIVKLEHDGGQVRAVHTAGGVHEVDALFAPSQTRPAADLAEQLGCTTVDGGMGPYLWADDRRQTSVPGVYAAGDLANPMQAISLAIGTGTAAGGFAHQKLLFG